MPPLPTDTARRYANAEQIRVGMSVGHAPGQPQWTPDMRKDEDQITEADKKDAKRRIQGQVGEAESPDDSGGDENLSTTVPSTASVSQI